MEYTRQNVIEIMNNFNNTLGKKVTNPQLNEEQISQARWLATLLNSLTISNVDFKKTKLINKYRTEDGTRLKLYFKLYQYQLNSLPRSIYSVLQAQYEGYLGKEMIKAKDYRFCVNIELIKDDPEEIFVIPQMYFLPEPFMYWEEMEGDRAGLSSCIISDVITNYMFKEKHYNKKVIKDYEDRPELCANDFIDLIALAQKTYWFNLVSRRKNLDSLFYNKDGYSVCFENGNFFLINTFHESYIGISYDKEGDFFFNEKAVFSKKVFSVLEKGLPNIAKEYEGSLYENLYHRELHFRKPQDNYYGYEFQEYLRIPYMLSSIQDYLSDEYEGFTGRCWKK